MVVSIQGAGLGDGYLHDTFFYVQSLILNVQTNYTISIRYRKGNLVVIFT